MNTRNLTSQMLLVCGIGLAWAPPMKAQTIESPYDAQYTWADLGPVPGLPTNYGGLIFKLGDPNTLVIGGNAATGDGVLYSVGVVRDAESHITGFSGTAAVVAPASYIDGGVAYGPSNVLFYAQFLGGGSPGKIGEIIYGSTNTDKVVDLTGLGTPESPGALTFVPAGFPGSGNSRWRLPKTILGTLWRLHPTAPAHSMSQVSQRI